MIDTNPTFQDKVRAYKRALIIEALKQTAGNVSKAARILRTRRTDVYRLIKLHEIPHSRDRSGR